MFVSLAVNSEDTLYSCARLMHYLPIRVRRMGEVRQS